MLEVKCFSDNFMSENGYFAADHEIGLSFVVDPGEDCPALEEAIDRFGADKLCYILLTHGHFDHIGGTARLKRRYPHAKIVIGEQDSPFTRNDSLNLSYHFSGTVEPFDADLTVNDGDVLSFGSSRITVIATPGHTRGGVCYQIDEVLFTGDTLMRGSMGRTDFPSGSSREMMESLQKLSELPGDYQLYCGHGASSTLEYERIYNYYMRSFSDDDIY